MERINLGEKRLQQLMMLRQMTDGQAWGKTDFDKQIAQTPEDLVSPYGLAPMSDFQPEEPYQPAPEVPIQEEEPDQEPQVSPEQPMSKASDRQLTRLASDKKGYNPQAFVDGLTKRGFTPEQAAAIAGNVHVESSFYSGIKSSVPGENSHGFMQWNSARLRGLQNYAASVGKDWRDPEAQMDWIALERSGDSVRYGGSNERGAYTKAFAEGGSPGELAVRVGKYVERPLDINATAHIRSAMADRYFNRV